MESAVGFYANKPLVVCSRHVLGRVWQPKKQETTQVGGKSQEMSARRGGPACTTVFRLDAAGIQHRYLLPVMMNRTGASSHLWGVVGERRALACAQPGGGYPGYGPLGGKSWGGVYERRAVAESGADDARLATHQLLVYVQCHWSRRVGKAQRRTERRRKRHI